MSAESENGMLASQILDRYYHGFQERNPQLRVFSAHIHMDEATPHIHIDFVPFTTGSKRGLETRVSLKQALALQGFKGGTRGDTEWNQWVSSEKEHLAKSMREYGVEWERKGTHEKHLSVLEYKKDEREKELEQVESKITEKKNQLKSYKERTDDLKKGIENADRISEYLNSNEEVILPEPTPFMSAKSYKAKFVDPVISTLKSMIKTLLSKLIEARDDYNRLNLANNNFYDENQRLSRVNQALSQKNTILERENWDYKFLRKKIGPRQVDELLKNLRGKNKKYDRGER